jgi:hypothetical protein
VESREASFRRLPAGRDAKIGSQQHTVREDVEQLTPGVGLITTVPKFDGFEGCQALHCSPGSLLFGGSGRLRASSRIDDAENRGARTGDSWNGSQHNGGTVPYSEQPLSDPRLITLGRTFHLARQMCSILRRRRITPEHIHLVDFSTMFQLLLVSSYVLLTPAGEQPTRPSSWHPGRLPTFFFFFFSLSPFPTISPPSLVSWTTGQSCFHTIAAKPSSRVISIVWPL